MTHILCLSSSFGSRRSSLQLHLKVLLLLPHVLQLTAQILHLSLMLLRSGDRRMQRQRVAVMSLPAETVQPGSVHQPQPQQRATS